MKKFTFSLNSLFEIKKTFKDKVQAEYVVAEAVLERAICEKVCLDKLFVEESEKYEIKVVKGITISEIQAYTIYFEELQEMIAAAAKDIERAQESLNRRQIELLEIFKEIKTLEKLRQNQYFEYLAEEERRETNVREDILAFHITEKAAGYSSSIEVS